MSTHATAENPDLEKERYLNTMSGHSIPLSEISDRIHKICGTEKTYMVESGTDVRTETDYYTTDGLKVLGRLVDFPHDFVSKINATNPGLAGQIIQDRVSQYFADGGSPFFIREFLGKGCGCVSSAYSFFDDIQVYELIADSLLSECVFVDAVISPERLHLVAIDADNSFRISGDNSDLYFAYFVDNSMTGLSSFSLGFGVYRPDSESCFIIPEDDIIGCKQVHRGDKFDLAGLSDEFRKSIKSFDANRAFIQDKLSLMAETPANINELSRSTRIAYLNGALVTSKKQTEQVLDLFNNVYGGNSEWDLSCAISEFAKRMPLEKRFFLESKALGISSVKFGLGRINRRRKKYREMLANQTS